MPKFNERKGDTFLLSLMMELLTQVERIFVRFKLTCKYRDGAGCNHPNYHADFALANICKLGSCPRLQEEEK